MSSNSGNLKPDVGTVKPKIIRPNLEKIPPELKEYDQWVCWGLKKKANGKFDKIPINPTTGRQAKTNDPSTWGHTLDVSNTLKTTKRP